ncbi:hypothetical protein V2J09_002199 [Rumex salicifolius]
MVLKKAIVDITSSDGTLSPVDFVAASHAFVEKWKSVIHDLPPWSWVSCKSTPLASSYQVDGYVALEKMDIFKSAEVNNGEVIDNELSKPSCFSDVEPEDDATLVEASDQFGGEVHYYDFHIVYSSSYRVPVLYFRGYRSDGLLLALDEIEKDLPASSSKVLTESKWTFITQMVVPPFNILHEKGLFEHPYMKRPWFMLHPCGTNELMRLLLEGDKIAMSDKKYIISWLSVVGQVVGIKVPLQMGVPVPQ